MAGEEDHLGPFQVMYWNGETIKRSRCVLWEYGEAEKSRMYPGHLFIFFLFFYFYFFVVVEVVQA